MAFLVTSIVLLAVAGCTDPGSRIGLIAGSIGAGLAYLITLILAKANIFCHITPELCADSA